MANDFAAPMSSKELVTFTLSEVILPTVDIYTDFALALKLVTFQADNSTVPDDVIKCYNETGYTWITLNNDLEF